MKLGTCQICGEDAPGSLLCNRHENAEKCRDCGDWIRIPVPNAVGVVRCSECSGGGVSSRINQDKGWLSDMNYHGDQWGKGEW